MEHLVRRCYKSGGYSFAKRAGDIARERGITRIARLASNENPEPPSPLAIDQGIAALREGNRYPDERVTAFVSALKKWYGSEYHFVAGVGMDGVIETAIRVLVEPGEPVAISTPTFSFYRLASLAQGAEVNAVPRNDDFSVDPGALIAVSRGAKLVFLCSPNNPTGNATPVETVEEILEGIDGVLFLDNAYVEFADFDYLPLLNRHDNLIIGRTMSKAYSLAGLRVGYAFVPSWFEPYYLRASTPFTVNMVSAVAAAGALRDQDHVLRAVRRVRKWRARFASELKYPVLPSDANFVMVDVSPHAGDGMAEKLAAQGVIVRSCASFTGLAPHYIRVSIGEDWENEMFISAINQL
jgi:histidinol-phosphate aminotransferase